MSASHTPPCRDPFCFNPACFNPAIFGQGSLSRPPHPQPQVTKTASVAATRFLAPPSTLMNGRSPASFHRVQAGPPPRPRDPFLGFEGFLGSESQCPARRHEAPVVPEERFPPTFLDRREDSSVVPMEDVSSSASFLDPEAESPVVSGDLLPAELPFLPPKEAGDGRKREVDVLPAAPSGSIGCAFPTAPRKPPLKAARHVIHSGSLSFPAPGPSQKPGFGLSRFGEAGFAALGDPSDCFLSSAPWGERSERRHNLPPGVKAIIVDAAEAAAREDDQIDWEALALILRDVEGMGASGDLARSLEEAFHQMQRDGEFPHFPGTLKKPRGSRKPELP